jgi:tetratricopeptide (TPR) repeat protein
MPAPQQLSPAELAALEQAFGADPSSESYRPLAEAYLAMGRFMEAMVVSKKGIKAHPADATPRLLLARIYAAQGKDARAQDELREALKLAPADAAALRLQGLLELKAGSREAGTASLRRAWKAAPDDPETLAAMKKHGVSPEDGAPAAGRPAAGPAAAAAPQPGGRAGEDAQRPAAAAPQPSPAAPVPGESSAGATTPTPRPLARADAAAYADRLAEQYATQEHALERARPRRRGTLAITISFAVLLALVLGGWGLASSMRKRRAVEIDQLLRQARELIEKDSFASYQEAAKLCQRILGLDRDSVAGHAYLAYIDALRWGELGEGEPLREEAKGHLEAVRKLGRAHSHAYAADAYLRLYGGDASGAAAELQKVLAGSEGPSPLLRSALGIVQMHAGDLDGAREALTFARQYAPGDVRSAQMLAEQWRRRGPGFEPQASALYDAVLGREQADGQRQGGLAPQHVPSLLGKAKLLLDMGQPAEAMKRVTRAIELGPAASPRQLAVAHALRGSLLHTQGKAAEGDAEERKALEAAPTHAEVHDLVGRRKLRGGDVPGAVAAFQRAIELEPTRLGFYVDLANALLRKPGGAQEAVAALERAGERAGNARITKLLGDAYRAAGDLERARGAYEKAIAMEKRYPEARVALALVERDRKEYGKAVDELQRAIQEYKDGTPAANAWLEVARIEQGRGAPTATVESAYGSALKADPHHCAALFGLGKLHAERSGKDAAASARPLLSRYLSACPRGADVAEAERLLRKTSAPPGRRRR